MPRWLEEVATPLVWNEWHQELWEHPDQTFKKYILNGISNRFRIGFDRRSHCVSATSNMHSVLDNAAVIQEYLEKEVLLGPVVGSVDLERNPVGTQLSPFGVIPKSNHPGKWRLIVDLSSPEGLSVNDGIEGESCSMKYLHLNEVTDEIVKSGKGTELAKMDIASAYRMVPVHPGGRPLLAVQWAGKIFFDTRLPFGLRSAPKSFTAVADTLQWIFRKRGVTWVEHYLDDYSTIGPSGSGVCEQNLEVMLSYCQKLGVPVSAEKCTGPSSKLTFLGFELDTISMAVRLPEEKLQRIKLLVQK